MVFKGNIVARSEYKSKISRYILTSILVGLPVEIFLGLLFFSDKRTLLLGLAVCIIVIPAFFIAYIASNYYSVRVTDDDIRFFKHGKQYLVVPFENNEFTSYTYTDTFLSIPTSVKKYLRVMYSSGQSVDYLCWGFTKETFEKLISEVVSISKDKERRSLSEKVKAPMGEKVSSNEKVLTDELDSNDEQFVGESFIFPKKELRKWVFNRHLKKFIMGVVVSIFATLYIAMFFPLFVSDPVQLQTMEIWSAAILIACIGIATFLYIARCIIQVKRIPKSIRITNDSIIIDDRTFLLSRIQRINMSLKRFFVPKKSSYRKLNIIESGHQYKYLLGHVEAGNKLVHYYDYGNLCFAFYAFMQQADQFVIFENI